MPETETTFPSTPLSRHYLTDGPESEIASLISVIFRARSVLDLLISGRNLKEGRVEWRFLKHGHLGFEEKSRSGPGAIRKLSCQLKRSCFL